jgi:integrase
VAAILKRRGKEGTRFTAIVRVAGQKKSQAQTFADERSARNWAAKIEEELREQRALVPEEPKEAALTIEILIDKYLHDPKVQRLKSLPEIERVLEGTWVNKCGKLRVADFGVAELKTQRDALLESGCSAQTVNRYVGALRSVWSFGLDMGYIAREQQWPARIMFKEPRGRTRYLSDAEISAVLHAAKSDCVMHAAITLAMATGLRRGELLALTWGDIDMSRAQLSVRESKNDTQRRVHLTSSALKALRTMPKGTPLASVFTFDGGRPLRVGVLDHKWRPIRKAAKLQNFRWHDFRHTCASILLQSGATLPEVGEILGHKSLAMTMRYAHLVSGKPTAGHAALDAKLRG